MSLPNLLNANLQTKSAWLRLSQAVSQTVNLGAAEKTAYVSESGNDAFAKLNSLTNQFGTVQGALNAIAAAELAVPGSGDGYTVSIGPGTFVGNIVIPNVDGLNIVGSGVTTFLQNVGASHTISLTAAAANTINSLTVRDLVVVNDQNNVALYGIYIDGTLTDTLFANGIFLLRDAYLLLTNTGSVLIQRAGQANIEGCTVASGGVSLMTLRNVAEVNAYNCNLKNAVVEWDGTDPVPAGTQNATRFMSCKTQDVLVIKQGKAVFDRGCRSADIDVVITDTATNYGEFEHHGSGQNVAITFDFNTADRSFFDMDHFDCSGSFAVAEVATTSAFRGLGHLRHGSFTRAQTLTVGNMTDLDIRQSVFRQEDVVSAGNATLDRSTWQHTIANGAANPYTVTFADAAAHDCPFPNEVLYGVVVSNSVIGDGPVSVTTILPGSCIVTKTAAVGTSYVTIVRT